jgi:hypothetical protein
MASPPLTLYLEDVLTNKNNRQQQWTCISFMACSDFSQTAYNLLLFCLK